MPNQSDMKMETTLSNEQIQLFKLIGMTIKDDHNGTSYYHLPQYFKDLGAGEFEVINFDDLPEDVKVFTTEYGRYEIAKRFLDDCDTIIAGEVYTEMGYNTADVEEAIKIASGLD